MPLYQINSDKLVTKIKPFPLTRERDLQKLFKSNVETLIGVRFIATEFTT
jgi:hypothetical protein